MHYKLIPLFDHKLCLAYGLILHTVLHNYQILSPLFKSLAMGLSNERIVRYCNAYHVCLESFSTYELYTQYVGIFMTVVFSEPHSLDYQWSFRPK